MDKAAFRAISACREDFKEKVNAWTTASPWLPALQERLKALAGGPDYDLETPIVYNGALDAIGPEDRIRYILVADNPGKSEQLASRRSYLVGQAGKIAEGFFRRELGIDFRREVLILNKTPVHTCRTAGLRALAALPEAGPLAALLAESQAYMARLARRLHLALDCPLWICGKGELGKRGVFSTWKAHFEEEYAQEPLSLREKVLVHAHFSMNAFMVDIEARRDSSKPIEEEIARIGAENRVTAFGW